MVVPIFQWYYTIDAARNTTVGIMKGEEQDEKK